MPYGIPAHARLCPGCEGFATAIVTTGARRGDGSRTTARVTCPTCQGTGIHHPARRREVARV